MQKVKQGIQRRWNSAMHNLEIARISREVRNQSPPFSGDPVLVFNASTRLSGMSLNAAFSLITSWAHQLQGVRTVQLVCQAGLHPCVLGTDRRDPQKPPPCRGCLHQSKAFYSGSDTTWFTYQADAQFDLSIEGLSLSELQTFQYERIPLGRLVLPSLRWILRRYHLSDDLQTGLLYKKYLRSAWSLYRQCEQIFDNQKFQAVLAFNGMFYPEAVLRFSAQQRGIPVITHEVGLSPMTGFFTTGDATAYPIDLPEGFHLSTEHNQRLEEYLNQRFQGNFSMAGVRFWSGMQGLTSDLLAKASRFKQIVPIFTNVIFDTSQDHANVVFPNMFGWLDQVADIIRDYDDTLFIIRAHPDELRPGKESLETVEKWFELSGLANRENVHFVSPQETLSSYQLINRSKFVMVYNSTIGLEASILGTPVLCGGKARFTQIPTVYFPPSQEEYLQLAREFLETERIHIPDIFRENARRFLYYQLFCVSLPFGDFLKEDPFWQGYVCFKKITHKDLLPSQSESIKTILGGILENRPFDLCQ